MAKYFRLFPFRVALVVLLFYSVTLSHGVTIESLSLTSKIAGWDWLPMARQPVFWLLTLPLRLLPAAWLPIGLNFFSAVCAAAVLGVLARTMELLPWFRPLTTLKGWSFRLPILIALVVCGMEFSFWQDATAVTGEMLDLLMLAIPLWCLLEYSADKKISWVQIAAVVWGAGMAENWTMQILLPLFVIALVMVRKLFFFERRFLLRMAGFGLAGFSIYALQATANGLYPGSPWNFSQAWLASLKDSKTILLVLHGEFWIAHRLVSVAVLLFFLVPPLAFVMRFGDDDTRNKSTLDQSLVWIFRGFRVVLLLFCIWLAFDPILGPRKLMTRQLNLALPLLTFDYLNALCIGFLAGNFLLAPSNDEPRRRPTLGQQLAKWLEGAVVPGLTVLLFLVALGLISRNLSGIELANRAPLTQIGELSLASLPSGGGIVFGDFKDNLELFQAAQARHRDKQGWLPVDLQSLPAKEYQARLARRRIGDWQASTNLNETLPGKIVQIISRLAQTNRIYCLHSSAGDLFEFYYQQPDGSVFELKPYPPSTISLPRLTIGEIKANEKFWDDCAPQIGSLVRAGGPSRFPLVEFADGQLFFEPVVPAHVGLLKDWYSMSLNSWGVELQRSGLLPAARRRFSQALDLNSNNWIARANLYCNSNLENRAAMSLENSAALSDQIGGPQKLAVDLNRFGTVDEPDCCYILGKAYQGAGLLRQAIQQFERARTLSPDELAPDFSLAELYARSRMDDQAMARIVELKSALNKMPANPGLDLQLALLETDVWLSQTNRARAERTLHNVVETHPDDESTLTSVSEAYFSFGDYTDADDLVSRILRKRPDDVPALLVRSGILIQTKRAYLAIPVLNQVLSLTNSMQAKLNRAIAYAQMANYSAARADYLELEKSAPDNFLADFGLAQLAILQRDTNQAVHYLNISLSKVPPHSAHWEKINAALESLRVPALE